MQRPARALVAGGLALVCLRAAPAESQSALDPPIQGPFSPGDAGYSYVSAVLPDRTHQTLLYMLCNLEDDNLAFAWKEVGLVVGPANPLAAHGCAVLERSAIRSYPSNQPELVFSNGSRNPAPAYLRCSRDVCGDDATDASTESQVTAFLSSKDAFSPTGRVRQARVRQLVTLGDNVDALLEYVGEKGGEVVFALPELAEEGPEALQAALVGASGDASVGVLSQIPAVEELVGGGFLESEDLRAPAIRAPISEDDGAGALEFGLRRSADFDFGSRSLTVLIGPDGAIVLVLRGELPEI